ncbi:MAG: hypothetical protein J5556_03435 [Deltaproteobacteria bacterium]|nr:hypothetical protein [Deltaproteobacteria bacterium]
MQTYQVGQQIAQFRGPDGLFLTIDESGAFLLCRMAAPTAKERRAFHSRQPLRIRMGEYGSVLYWTVQFGDIPMMDCTYCPQLAKGKPVLDTPEESQGYALTVLLADGDTGEVLSIRLAGLPHDFSLALRETVKRISAQPLNPELAIAALYSLSTQELADRAAYQCLL